MVMDLDATLERIRLEQQQAGENWAQPADAASLERLRAETRAKLSADLPAGYVDFLRRTNGLDFNGIVIYAADEQHEARRIVLGFLESNRRFRAVETRDQLLFGETGDELFAHDPNHAWCILDRGSLSPLETFSSFDDLLEHVVRRAYES